MGPRTEKGGGMVRPVLQLTVHPTVTSEIGFRLDTLF
jgi:hypothetical protein